MSQRKTTAWPAHTAAKCRDVASNTNTFCGGDNSPAAQLRARGVTVGCSQDGADATGEAPPLPTFSPVGEDAPGAAALQARSAAGNVTAGARAQPAAQRALSRNCGEPDMCMCARWRTLC